MKNPKNRGLIGLLMVLIIGVGLIAAIEWQSFHDKPGGVIGQLLEQKEEIKNVWNYAFSKYASSTVNQLIDITKNASSTDNVDTSGWKTYSNTKYGFEFKYPDQYAVFEEKYGTSSDPYDYIALANKDYHGDGLTGLSLAIYPNRENLPLSRWQISGEAEKYSKKYSEESFMGQSSLVRRNESNQLFYIIFIRGGFRYGFEIHDELGKFNDILSTFKFTK